MSEDHSQGPGEPEGAGQAEPVEQPEQPLAEASFAEEPLREEASVPEVSQPEASGQPVSESIIPEQPATRPAYPPPPEFYAQLPEVNPNRPPAAPVWQAPVPGMPMYPPMPGTPGYQPPMPGYPPLPPGYVYVPVTRPDTFRYDFPPIPPVEKLAPGQAVRDLPRQYKKILFKPGVRSFMEEQGRAEWGIIWIQLLFQLFLAAALSIPDFFFPNQASSSSTVPGLPSNFLLIETVALVILGPALFFAGVGIQYLLARLFKGHGSFKQQAYNQLLYSVPLGIVSSLAGALFLGLTGGPSSLMTVYLAPSSGATAPGMVFNGGALVALLIFYLISLGVGIYSIILNVFSIMATHRMTGGKATAVVLLPYAALFLLYIIVVFILVFIAIASASTIR